MTPKQKRSVICENPRFFCLSFRYTKFTEDADRQRCECGALAYDIGSIKGAMLKVMRSKVRGHQSAGRANVKYGRKQAKGAYDEHELSVKPENNQ